MALRELYLCLRHPLVRNVRKQMVYDVQPHLPLVIRVRNEPGCPRGIRRHEHFIARARVVIPTLKRLQIHLGELPGLSLVVNSRFEPLFLLFGTHLEPIFQQDDARVDDRSFHIRNDAKKAFGFFFTAKAHDALHASAIVPAAVEDRDFSPRRQVRQVSLDIHLRFLALGRGRKRDHAEYPRAHSGGDSFNRTPLASTIPPFEDDANLFTLTPDPFLKLDKLHVQFAQLLLVILALELVPLGLFVGWRSIATPFAVLLVLRHVHVTSSPCTMSRTL